MLKSTKDQTDTKKKPYVGRENVPENVGKYFGVGKKQPIGKYEASSKPIWPETVQKASVKPFHET